MIERVFDLDDTIAREVMVPRPDVVSISADDSLSEIRSIVTETKHTRYPVVETGNGDQVIGFLDAKDVIEAADNGGEDAVAEDLAREIIVVPETIPINDLLLQFRDDQQQMAAIIDEWGALEGIATVEDVVEAVVGDLRDEFDTETREPAIQRRDDGVYDIDGSLPLSLASETLGAEFAADGFDTVGGMLLEQINRAPEVGDTVEESGYQFEVSEIEGNRILAVEAHAVDPSGEQ
jgi:CBS domain containing-hemolysin-like protein